MNDAGLAALIESTASISLVQLFRWRLRSWCSPRLTYACWLIPWLSLMAIFIPGGRRSTILSRAGAPATRILGSVHALAGRLADAVPFSQGIMAAVWSIAALTFLGCQITTYSLSIYSASRDTTTIRLCRGISVARRRNVVAPFAAGVLRRRIFVPHDVALVFSLDEQLMVLRRECAHHYRHDTLANVAAIILLSMHWWNPLAYRAYRRFRSDQELACDAAVIAGLGSAAQYAYGAAILKCIAAQTCGAMVVPIGNRIDAGARITAITATPRITPGTKLPAALAVTLLATATMFSVIATRGLIYPPDTTSKVTASSQSSFPHAPAARRHIFRADPYLEAQQSAPDALMHTRPVAID